MGRNQSHSIAPFISRDPYTVAAGEAMPKGSYLSKFFGELAHSLEKRKFELASSKALIGDGGLPCHAACRDAGAGGGDGC